MEREGGCLCGAVRYTATLGGTRVGACHCGMCRRWAGGPYLTVHLEDIRWEPSETLAFYPSSRWAERGFCSRCGASLCYRITLPGMAMTNVSLGSLDDQSGLTLTHELYTDLRPEAYCFAGELEGMTEAEVIAKYGG